MFVWTNFVLTVTQLLSGLLSAYFWVVIIAAVLSWIEPNPYNPIVRTIYAITEPLFGWIRDHLPVFFGGIDFSPLVVILGIELLQGWFIPSLRQILVYGFT